jgi:hypothetical protein
MILCLGGKFEGLWGWGGCGSLVGGIWIQMDSRLRGNDIGSCSKPRSGSKKESSMGEGPD